MSSKSPLHSEPLFDTILRALEAGVPSFHLQAIGGWKSPVMLQRYGKVRNKALHEQMAKLNEN